MSISIDIDTQFKLKATAKAQGKSRSEMLREWIDDRLRNLNTQANTPGPDGGAQ